MKKGFFWEFILFLGIMVPGQFGHSENESVYWMKISAADKVQRSLLANTGISIDIVMDDYIIATGNRNSLSQVEKTGLLQSSFPMNEELDFPKEDSEYHNYDELKMALEKLNKQYPSHSVLEVIGKSLEGRDIFVLKISGQVDQLGNKPAVLFMGGHHAREHLSVETPLRFAQYLLAEYDKKNARIMGLLDNREVHIIPAVNPDGLEFDVSSGRYKYWRKNRRANKNGTYGVDLNRNYSFHWGTGGSSTDPSSDVYMGPQPFSEPETKAIQSYVVSNSNISILLSFHTFSELILYPWGHTYDPIGNAQDRSVHEKMAQYMAQFNRYTPQQSSDLYIASGDTTDWSYGENHIVSFTFELDPKGGGASGFYPGAGVINSVVQKNIEPCLYLIEMADNPYRALGSDPLTPSLNRRSDMDFLLGH